MESKISHIPAFQTCWISDTASQPPAGGWIDARYHAMSWALSCLLLKSHFSEVTLTTDRAGKKWLIDALQLPYDTVNVVLDDQKSLTNYSWVLLKLWSMAQMEKAFLHADGDLFLWECPSEDLLNAPLFAQHFEVGYPAYSQVFDWLVSQNATLPPFFDNVQQIVAVNMGLTGGQNPDFYKRLFQNAHQFFSQNTALLNEHSKETIWAIFSEQILYNYQAQSEKINIKTIIKPSFRGSHKHFSNFVDVDNPASPLALIHLLGDLRLYLFHCKQVVFHLRYRFPNDYERVEHWFRHIHYDTRQTRFDVSAGLYKERTPPAYTYYHVQLALQDPFQRSRTLPADSPYMADCKQYEKRRQDILQAVIENHEVLAKTEFERFVRFKEWVKSGIDWGEFCFVVNPTYLLQSNFNWHQFPLPHDTPSGPIYYDLIIDYQTLYLQEFTFEPLFGAILTTLVNAATGAELVEKLSAQGDSFAKPAIFVALKTLYLKSYLQIL